MDGFCSKIVNHLQLGSYLGLGGMLSECSCSDCAGMLLLGMLMQSTSDVDAAIWFSVYWPFTIIVLALDTKVLLLMQITQCTCNL